MKPKKPKFWQQTYKQIWLPIYGDKDTKSFTCTCKDSTWPLMGHNSFKISPSKALSSYTECFTSSSQVSFVPKLSRSSLWSLYCLLTQQHSPSSLDKPVCTRQHLLLSTDKPIHNPSVHSLELSVRHATRPLSCHALQHVVVTHLRADHAHFGLTCMTMRETLSHH